MSGLTNNQSSKLDSEEIDAKLNVGVNFDNVELNFAKDRERSNSKFTRRFGKMFDKVESNK